MRSLQRPRRYERCPCGSGRKYKHCCIRPETKADPAEHPLLKDAIQCFRWGFFEGAIERCAKLRQISSTLEIASASVDLLSCVYSGSKKNHHVAQQSRFIKQILLYPGQDGPCAAEFLWLFFEYWDGQRWKFPNGEMLRQESPFQQVLNFIHNQNGVLGFHPTAVLGLARLAVEGSNLEIAKSLMSCVLGWRSEFVEVADLEVLANLMAKLRAPVILWSDWAAHFYQHVDISHLRDQIAAEIVNAKDFTEWAAEQNRESENVLIRVLKIAPTELPEIMKAMIPHFAWSGFENPLTEIAGQVNQSRSESDTRSDSPAVCDASWYSQPDIKARYNWHGMIAEHEQCFVTNGDWAMFCSPTEDYSMGLAQWWRIIESVFGRIVVRELGLLFDSNPQWLAQDHERLSERSRNSESVFLQKLANASTREKMTTADILLVLEKCVVKPRPVENCDSILRQNATKYFEPYSKAIVDSILPRAKPPLLTIQNIGWFRNRASHSEPIGLADACVGRLVAKRIVDLLFAPQLRACGLKATIPILIDNSNLDILIG